MMQPTVFDMCFKVICHSPKRFSNGIVKLGVGSNEVEISLNFLFTAVKPVVQLCFNLFEVHGVFDDFIVPVPKQNEPVN